MIFSLANAVGVALYVVGFAETVADLIIVSVCSAVEPLYSLESFLIKGYVLFSGMSLKKGPIVLTLRVSI